MTGTLEGVDLQTEKLQNAKNLSPKDMGCINYLRFNLYVCQMHCRTCRSVRHYSIREFC